jgi:hypothetical protein
MPSWRGAQLKHRDNSTFTYFNIILPSVLRFTKRYVPFSSPKDLDVITSEMIGKGYKL